MILIYMETPKNEKNWMLVVAQWSIEMPLGTPLA